MEDSVYTKPLHWNFKATDLLYILIKVRISGLKL